MPARVRLGSHTVWPALHAGWSPGAAPLQSGRHAGVLMVRAPLAYALGPSTSHRGGLPHRRSLNGAMQATRSPKRQVVIKHASVLPHTVYCASLQGNTTGLVW